ncbi:hypothetical protein ACXR0O_17005 [Verrucomicrobiota bacterium sgz303538]
MLREFQARQLSDDYRRRWFSDQYFDLYVWYEADGSIHGFQLAYAKPGNEHALTWTSTGGFRHSAVDSGESSPFSGLTPILIAGGHFPAAKVAREFRERASELEPDTRELVIEKIREFDSSHLG